MTSMRVVDLLADGPSLSKYSPGQPCCISVVAVNRASNKYDCDWQVCSDWQSIDLLNRNPRIGWIIPKATLAYRKCDGKHILYESFSHMLPASPTQCNFSGVAALAACCLMFPDMIRVWGMDLSPSDEPGRDKHRFAKERRHLDELLRRIRDIGYAPEIVWRT